MINLKNHDFAGFCDALTPVAANRTEQLKLFASVFSHGAKVLADVKRAPQVRAVVRDFVQTHGELPSLKVVERRKADGDAIADIHDDVQWMGLLRSVSALQMYQRATRGPIDGAAAVRFLLLDPTFPRSVASCATRIREALSRLPRSRRTLPVMDELERVLAASASGDDDGALLDAAMEDVQAALAAINDVVHEAFVRSRV